MLNAVHKRYSGIALKTGFFHSGYIILEFEKVYKVIKHFLGQTKHVTFMMQRNTVMWNFQKFSYRGYLEEAHAVVT